MDADRFQEILKRLGKEYPNPKTALDYSTPFELLVAVILSAQTTDAQVNRVTEKLFRKYRSINDYAEAPLEELTQDVKSVNFFNNKAKNIRESARTIIGKFDSQVPKTMEDLTSLPGVARKTANIILSEVYGINEGIAVDTHVRRLSRLMGLTAESDPVRIERDLMKMIPKKKWAEASHLLILHGRGICKARNPDHKRCVVSDICPSSGEPGP